MNICHGRGYDAFRLFFKDRQPRQPLSVFLYCGDSIGESGSGFYWLGQERLRNVLEVLEDGGLIVTDGSNSRVRQLGRFYGDRGIGRAALEAAEAFEFSGKWRFECIGYLGERYGPILVWRVTRIRSDAQENASPPCWSPCASRTERGPYPHDDRNIEGPPRA